MRYTAEKEKAGAKSDARGKLLYYGNLGTGRGGVKSWGGTMKKKGFPINDGVGGWGGGGSVSRRGY